MGLGSFTVGKYELDNMGHLFFDEETVIPLQLLPDPFIILKVMAAVQIF